MGKITEALKKVGDVRMSIVKREPMQFQYVIKKAENTNIDQHIVSFHDPASPVGEQYKILRTHIQSLKCTAGNKVFVVTSSISGEGKTVTAMNLAITMAHDLNDKKILLVDADMRKGRIADYLGLGSHPGLSELLEDKVKEEDVFINPGIENLTVVLSGKAPKNPSELLNSKRMEKLISLFKAKFDYIFIDTPPTMSLADACILGPVADGVILVIQAARTQRDIIKNVKNRLFQAHAKILGYVMTNIEYHLPGYLYRYINEYSGYHLTERKGE